MYIYIYIVSLQQIFRNYEILHKLSQTGTESVVRGNLLENQGFICYRPVSMMQHNYFSFLSF